MRDPSTSPIVFIVALVVFATPVFLGEARAEDEIGAGDLWLESESTEERRDLPASPYPALVDQVGPAVVNINVRYEGRPIPARVRRMLEVTDSEHLPLGSGVIIHPEGYVVTNYHVIEGADSVTVALDDGTELAAQVLGGDVITDIALLEAETSERLPSAFLGDSSSLQVGEHVVAIGNPFGLSHTVTAGIISSIDRRNIRPEGRQSPVNFIQTDAPITQGNSGGPLLNLDAEVIGITSVYSPSAQHIGFAIPVDLLKRLLPRLHADGYIERSSLGLRVQPITALLARSYDLEGPRGALVTEIVEDSPASRAGFEEEDIIVNFDETEIEHSDELPLLVSLTPAERATPVRIVRDGETIDLEVELETVPDQSPPELPGTASPPVTEADAEPAGVKVEAMTEQKARQLSVPEGSGVVVTALARSSPARKAGLRDRDVIIDVDSASVDTVLEFHNALEQSSMDSVIRLKVIRNGRVIYVAFERQQ